MSNFGQGAEVVEPPVTMPEGDYQIKIGMPEDVVKNGYNIRKNPIFFRGQKGECNPSSWDWFDIPTDDPEKLIKWNRAMTKNCDAFGVKRLDFRAASWANKTGWVHIGKNTKTGYMEVKWALLKEEVGKPAPKEMTKADAKPAAKPAPAKPEVDPELDNGYQEAPDNTGDPWGDEPEQDF
jgi:hypothetical protein